MKKALIIVVAMLLLGAGVALANIAGSPHDLTTGYTGADYASCTYCHTPHRPNTAMSTAPLWNRNAPTSTYTLYAGTGGVSGTTTCGTTLSQPGNNSKTCLSCHDGTMAVGDLYNAGMYADDVITGGNLDANGNLGAGDAGYIGTDLRDDHPVGLSISGANSCAGTLDAAGMTAAGFRLYGTTNDFECGSCHDPHSWYPTTTGRFLRVSESTICSACHATK